MVIVRVRIIVRARVLVQGRAIIRVKARAGAAGMLILGLGW